MNARQAAKMAAKHIEELEHSNEELEHFNRLCSRDIKAYNIIIDGQIAGTLNVCDWCNDQEDCAPSNQGHGCKDWCLKFDLTDEEVGIVVDESEGVPVEGFTGRAGDQDNQGKAPSL